MPSLDLELGSVRVEDDDLGDVTTAGDTSSAVAAANVGAPGLAAGDEAGAGLWVARIDFNEDGVANVRIVEEEAPPRSPSSAVAALGATTAEEEDDPLTVTIEFGADGRWKVSIFEPLAEEDGEVLGVVEASTAGAGAAGTAPGVIPELAASVVGGQPQAAAPPAEGVEDATPPPPSVDVAEGLPDVRCQIEVGEGEEWTVRLFVDDFADAPSAALPAASPSAAESAKPKLNAKQAWAKAAIWARAASKAVLWSRAAAAKADREEGQPIEYAPTDGEWLVPSPDKAVVSSAVAWARAAAAEAAGETIPEMTTGSVLALAAEREEAAAVAADGGGWTPPRIKVRLLERSDADQVAIRVDAPTGESGGDLIVSAHPMPAFDVHMSRVEE